MILVCTLGGTWQVIPEAYALIAPQRCALYNNHPEQPRKFFHIPEPSEVWLVTTSGTKDRDHVEQWWQKIGEPVPLRWFVAEATDGQAQDEVELIREVIFRVVLKAGHDAVLSLAGGRKTMSADMQRAGTVFGCQAMLHVIPPDAKDADEEKRKKLQTAITKRINDHSFHTPLPQDLCIQGVNVGRGKRNDLLDVENDGKKITVLDYSISEGTFIADGTWLWKEIEQREQKGGQLVANFHKELVRDETHENWR